MCKRLGKYVRPMPVMITKQSMKLLRSQCNRLIVAFKRDPFSVLGFPQFISAGKYQHYQTALAQSENNQGPKTSD